MDKLFVSGFEFIFLDNQRIEKIITEMIQDGKIKENEAADMRKVLLKKYNNQREEFLKGIEKIIKNKIDELGLVTRDEIAELEKKIRSLETYIDENAKVAKQ